MALHKKNSWNIRIVLTCGLSGLPYLLYRKLKKNIAGTIYQNCEDGYKIPPQVSLVGCNLAIYSPEIVFFKNQR